MISNKWEELTPLEFDEAIEKSGGLCVLPMGCIERHGDHIAVGCDSFQASLIANEAASREYAVVFPTGMWVGNVMGAQYHPEKSGDAGLMILKSFCEI